MNVAVLAPGLNTREAKLLATVIRKSTLHPSTPLTYAQTWADVWQSGARHVLSVGKQALDLWHHYGLIQVGAHHGKVFLFTDATLAHTRYTIMQLEHPGTLLQMSLGGSTARAEMLHDLANFSLVLRGFNTGRFAMGLCGKCQAGKGSVRRPAVHWDERLDMVGLCEDHWRTRAKIVRKDRVKKVKVASSKPEAQVAGQLTMAGVVAKKS